MGIVCPFRARYSAGVKGNGEKLYTVQEVRELVHVTRKTLFYYDRYDLLKPAAVKGPGRYKLYGSHEIALLKKIRKLQEAGLQLKEIHALLCEPDTDPMTVLKGAERRLRQEKEQIETQLENLKALMKCPESI